jgi:nucleotide-binding universal stress UspA family protein
VRVRDITIVQQGPKIRLGQMGKSIHNEPGKAVNDPELCPVSCCCEKVPTPTNVLTALHNGCCSGGRRFAIPPDPNDHACGIPGSGPRSDVARYRLGFAASVCDRDRGRAYGGPFYEYLSFARAVHMVREAQRQAARGRRSRGIEFTIMFQLQRILFPVDFSERCRGAAAYVEALVGRFDAELILLHVIEATYNSTLEDLQETQREKFRKFFGKDLKHLRVKEVVDHGEAGRKIIECASANRVNLIMIPTQGMGIYRRLILGSTSAKVLHDADCPVWTGVHLENAPSLEAVTCDRIVCALDLKPVSMRVLDWAARLSDEYQAELTLVHVLPEGADRAARSRAREELEILQEAVRVRGVLRVDTGEVSKVVAELSAEMKADLLVIGRKAEAGILGRLEMTAYSIIRQSACPVVSV